MSGRNIFDIKVQHLALWEGNQVLQSPCYYPAVIGKITKSKIIKPIITAGKVAFPILKSPSHFAAT